MAISDLSGLTAWWPLEEPSGNRRDATPNGNDLAAVGEPDNVAGKIGFGIQESIGDFDYLEAASAAWNNPGDTDFSFAGWVYLDTKATDQSLVSKWNLNSAEASYNTYYKTSTDRFVFAVTHDGSTVAEIEADSLGAPSLATWYFVVVWHDATANTINIQINNGTVDSLAHSLGVQTSTQEYRMGVIVNGGGSNDDDLDGRLDEWSLWARVLTSGERTDLYNAGSGVTYSDLIDPPNLAFLKAWWDYADLKDSKGANDWTNNGGTFIDHVSMGLSIDLANADTDSLQQTAGADLLTLEDSWTFNFVFNADGLPATGRVLAGQWNAVAEQRFQFTIANGILNVSIRNPNAGFTASENILISTFNDFSFVIDTDYWLTIAYDFDNDSVSVFLNAEGEEAQASTPRTMRAVTVDWFLGRIESTGISSWDGAIGQTIFWKGVAMDQANHNWFYNDGVIRDFTGGRQHAPLLIS